MPSALSTFRLPQRVHKRVNFVHMGLNSSVKRVNSSVKRVNYSLKRVVSSVKRVKSGEYQARVVHLAVGLEHLQALVEQDHIPLEPGVGSWLET